MIKSIAQLLSAASSRRVAAMSRQVAEMSVEDVCAAVGGKVESMSLSEARGYVRARAAGIVRKQTRLVVAQDASMRPMGAEAVARMATELLVPLVLRKTGVGVPNAASPLRLAA